MGVPGFVKWLYKKGNAKNFVSQYFEQVDALLLDANSLLHPICFKVLDENPEFTNIDILEDLMIERCYNYILEIINIIKPTKLVYVAIDGVAPVAKIAQQRYRRYKSINDHMLYDNIKRKYNKPIKKFWSNSAITPGTSFQDKITKKFKTLPQNTIFSSSDEASEGEHKILEYIKKHNMRYMIYGLDADLIFLSLASNKRDIYLMREEKDGFIYFSIDKMREEISNRVENIDDFIFICYFLGNDFLPHLISIDIKNDGIDILIEVYNIIIKKYKFIIGEKINKKALYNFIELLSIKENNYIPKKRYIPKIQTVDPYERELYKIDNLLFKIDDPIRVGEEGWQSRYYKHYFKDDSEETKKKLCYKYLEGLHWINLYYFKGCPSWEWYYTFTHAPLLVDIVKYFNVYRFGDSHFKLGKPLKPIEQLTCVLPPQLSYLLPKKINLSDPEIADLYPKKFTLDMLYKTRYWECIPEIPTLDVKRVVNYIRKIKL